jgi:hypothetical protein
VSEIEVSPLPDRALLAKYTVAGAYTDCYTTEVARPVSHAEFVEAFYTSRVFKLERFLLRWLVSKPSTDLQARQLATGELNAFSAWMVEDRIANQLLMCDYRGITRSWLMVAPSRRDGSATTRLYFGSAVVPVVHEASGRKRMGFVFRALLGFHKLYSRVLLRSALSRLSRERSFE